MVGKAGALARLFAEHRSALRGFFARRGGEADAEDLVQEAWLRLLRVYRSRGETIANPEAYLYTVATNLAREQAMRRRQGPSGTEDIDRFASVLSSGACAEEEIERLQRRRRLQAAFASLPERTRAVLLMQYRDALTYRQIGQRMGISTHMVKKHVVRGLAECRRVVAEDGDDR